MTGAAVTRACALSDLVDGEPLGVDIGDVPVVLVRQGEQVHALRNWCSHAAVALSEGELTRRGLECWLHGSCFDLRTGLPSSPPATDPIPVYPVTVDGDDVHVDVTSTLN
ncbi:non-heme iron oxygenase ferredoxin subunit [Actinokineospora inagensis]|uniref:non-heme iron oxygenase ferredoxin subunit n=1 Tax=Actinokineospora inagensis TaxID=103730 RepID=UPI0004224E12|nr:non-heme iron oxygenase ferredoxin subunit [Actinokineospora inagensis]